MHFGSTRFAQEHRARRVAFVSCREKSTHNRAFPLGTGVTEGGCVMDRNYVLFREMLVGFTRTRVCIYAIL